MAPPAYETSVELQSDQEHEEDEADLGEHAEERQYFRREQIGGRLRPRGPEDGRSEEDPRRDLAHHLGLIDPAEETAYGPRHDDDHEGREQEPPEDLVRRMGRSRRPLGHLGRMQVATGHQTQLQHDQRPADQRAVEQHDLLAAGGPETLARALVRALVGVHRHAPTLTLHQGVRTPYAPL